MGTESQVDAAGASVPAAPRSLGKAGRAAWRMLCSEYVFAPGEVGLLTEYCANLDMLALLRAELAAGELTVISPQAGPVVNRMIAEIRASQAELRKLAEALRFREQAVDAEREAFPALREADLMHARPVVGPRDPRSHRRRAA
jgi:HAMP domain-containing protein